MKFIIKITDFVCDYLKTEVEIDLIFHLKINFILNSRKKYKTIDLKINKKRIFKKI